MSACHHVSHRSALLAVSCSVAYLSSFPVLLIPLVKSIPSPALHRPQAVSSSNPTRSRTLALLRQDDGPAYLGVQQASPSVCSFLQVQVKCSWMVHRVVV